MEKKSVFVRDCTLRLAEDKYDALKTLLHANKHLEHSAHAGDVEQWGESVGTLTQHFRAHYDTAHEILRVAKAKEDVNVESFPKVVEAMRRFTAAGPPVELDDLGRRAIWF